MNNDAKKLLNKYREGACTPEELAMVESWYLDFEEEDTVLTLEELDIAKDSVWAGLPVHESVRPKQVKLWPRYTRIAAAAVIILSVSVGLYIYSKNTERKDDIVAVVNHNIIPGGKKALLTLANGKSIVLSDAQNGKLADQTGTSIFKTAGGEIVYNNESDHDSKVEYNQLSIPRGGYYVLTMADGTKVWLNSESTLKYPTDFVGSERVVELTGEGYFEVAHRKGQPFKVITSKQTVEVLGTHFNINAYDNEKVTTTTLLEGSVKVALLGAEAKQLKPGQQAILKNDDIAISEADTEGAIAWVNNKFSFNKEDLGSIMRQLSRWYDVDVVCPANLEQLQFNGNMSRDKNIKDMIKIMEKTKDVNFKIEGRRITVMH
jgi:transmembrane sensor